VYVNLIYIYILKGVCEVGRVQEERSRWICSITPSRRHRGGSCSGGKEEETVHVCGMGTVSVCV